MKLPLPTLTIFALSLAWSPLAQANLTIDGFDLAQGVLTGDGAYYAISGPGILGSERDVELAFPATSTFSIMDGVLTLTQTSGFSRVFITYDGIDNSASIAMGLGGFDLLSLGTSFQVAVPSTAGSTPHAHLFIRAYTSSSDYSEEHLVLTNGDFPSLVTIPFATMDKWGLGANFSNINAIQMELAIGSGINMDMNVDSIAVVPEPSSAVLLFGMALGFGARRRAGVGSQGA